ncbi:RNA polymerase sigma factor region1.1 domain-containing protein, partial [Pseudorhodoplanes sp.]|uniref:RNA polymerase sigma factor region1.1 domain-containing protein n=1 Tax=Pseudorhodoplanes sp. TaxID=1934341 RepID=UPI002CD9969F
MASKSAASKTAAKVKKSVKDTVKSLLKGASGKSAPKPAPKPEPKAKESAKSAPKASAKEAAKTAPKSATVSRIADKTAEKAAEKTTPKSSASAPKAVPVSKVSPMRPEVSRTAALKAGAKAVSEKEAVKAKAAGKDESDKDTEATPDTPLPLLDLSDAAVKKMIKQAKKRGYITYEQLNAVMPSEEVTSEQIEDTLSMLSEMGINVIEQDEASDDDAEKEEDDDDEGGELVEVTSKPLIVKSDKEPSERTDDPVRMYLREMGSVELLSREGEIAIAKRIEAGREAMIAGLCESPLTFQAIIIWRDELNEGKVFLRDIIDLEATYAGPDAKMPAPVGPDGKPLPGAEIAQEASPPSAPTGATPFKAAPAGDAEEKDPGELAAEADMEDDEFENSMSLAAIELELKPKVLETFDTVANEYKKLRKLQEQDIANRLQNESLSPSQERKYKKLKDEIITA